jgi:riboflavin-specific deaminase-like protein
MGPVTIGQIGQTLDGRIATETGHSHYINGPAGLDHLHRLRALADAVIVGVETVDTDDPRLTTRRVPGGNPVRIVLDPRGRVPATRHVFDGAAPTIVITGPQPGERFGSSLPGTEVICLPLSADDGRMDRGAVLAALRARGLGTVLVEGGPRTLSLFLEDGLLDRLHIALSPRLFGSGRAAVILPPIARVDDGHRFRMLVYRLGTDLLLDCRPRNGTQGPITRGRADPGDRP